LARGHEAGGEPFTGVRNVRGGGDRCGDNSGDVPEKADEEQLTRSAPKRWVTASRPASFDLVRETENRMDSAAPETVTLAPRLTTILDAFSSKLVPAAVGAAMKSLLWHTPVMLK
jgi:hypothetical protein